VRTALSPTPSARVQRRAGRRVADPLQIAATAIYPTTKRPLDGYRSESTAVPNCDGAGLGRRLGGQRGVEDVARLLRANLMHRRRLDRLLQIEPPPPFNPAQLTLQWHPIRTGWPWEEPGDDDFILQERAVPQPNPPNRTAVTVSRASRKLAKLCAGTDDDKFEPCFNPRGLSRSFAQGRRGNLQKRGDGRRFCVTPRRRLY